MGDVDYRPDYRSTGDGMRSPEMQACVAEAAAAAMPVAMMLSPDAPPYGEGYIASFSVDPGHVERIAGTKRAVAYLVNDSDHAVEVELGVRGDLSRSDTGHHVLAKVIDYIERG